MGPTDFSATRAGTTGPGRSGTQRAAGSSAYRGGIDGRGGREVSWWGGAASGEALSMRRYVAQAIRNYVPTASSTGGHQCNRPFRSRIRGVPISYEIVAAAEAKFARERVRECCDRAGGIPRCSIRVRLRRAFRVRVHRIRGPRPVRYPHPRRAAPSSRWNGRRAIVASAATMNLRIPVCGRTIRSD